MITALRNNTQQLHRIVEEENLARFILDHSIDPETYKLLLLQNYIAYAITEAEIARHLPDYQPGKYSRLKTDLDALNVDSGICTEYKDKFTCNNPIEAIGAAYVVEGSALGGLVISQELKHCPKLKGMDHNFFSEKHDMTGWKNFKKMVSSRTFTPEEIKIATKKAQDTFRFFREVFQLEPQIIR